ncbi:esterase family protein [Mycobacterium sp. TNTM28]|uniref:Esterase family protein n=1 Tax=[Mycobacterium] fortunisiensis TaxID=2600579 RepID=A0ABS6KMR2_9MYCO|nr:alpha/beta hydrolase-fold protein [[Mycobacterium] fortunisiensis]MBU9764863.1 esterase family protein [[Mycobacterium] fortunisiensis]
MRTAELIAVAADRPGAPLPQGLSLLDGWLPATIQLAAVVVLIVAAARSSRRWPMVCVTAAAIGAGLALAVRWYVFAHGMTTNPVPVQLWVWIGLSGAALVVLVLGWRATSWWRRGAAVAAVPSALVCVLLATNIWIGYFPTVELAWAQLSAGPLPDEVSEHQLAERRRSGNTEGPGAVIRIDVPDTGSGFRHRQEIVYLPPAWFAADPAPQLPVVLLIGGAFNTPEDWARTGNAIATVDAYAAENHGYSPILVLPDVGGSFNNDTECVNGPRGNVADHLTRELVPYVQSRFGTRPAGHGWGIIGFSMGGTCATGLTVRHPDIFSAFVNMGGDIGPNVGTEEATLTDLFGGDADAVKEFDPREIMSRHGPYTGVSGWFVVFRTPQGAGKQPPVQADTPPQCDILDVSDDQSKAARTLCTSARNLDIEARVTVADGDHDWPMAGQMLATTLPWMSERLGTPGVAPDPNTLTDPLAVR